MTALPAAPAVVAGDRLARLYETHRARLYRFCYSRLRSREEAEDAVQTTFLRAHAAMRRGVEPRLELAWLCKIAHNVCLDRLQATGRRARIEETRDFDEAALALAAPEPKREELKALAAALETMPENLRRVILLREWQGLSYAEIADELGTSVSAVETLVFRARRRLASALAEVAPRRVAAAWDVAAALAALRTLVARLRTFLSATTPAKVAAGAAVLAVGGAALGTAVATSTPAKRHAPPLVGDAPTPAAAVSPAVARASTPTIRKRRAPNGRDSFPHGAAAGVPGEGAPQPAVAGPTGDGVAAAPAPAVDERPPSEPPPAAPPDAPAHAVAPAGPDPQPSSPQPAVPVPTLPAVPTPPLPVEPPHVEPPAVSVPTVTVPPAPALPPAPAVQPPPPPPLPPAPKLP